MTQTEDLGIDSLLSQALAEGATISSLTGLILSATGQSEPPVNLSRIVELWPGLRVTVDDLDGEGYFIDLGERSGEILVKRATPQSRRRFTLAHELGHWTLTLSKESTKESTAQVERWCDEFASELLVPRSWLRASLEPSQRSLASVVSALPANYQVSKQTMWIQCSHHGLLSLVIAGRRLEEYPAHGARPAERGALVRAVVEYRDRGSSVPQTFMIGGWEGVVFKASRAVTMGVLNYAITKTG